MIQPVIVIHGGAGRREGRHAQFKDYAQRLDKIVAQAYDCLLAQGPRNAVIEAVKALEDDPIFNAGYGARLQRDGNARLTAALIDSETRRFSGVINIERVQHPIETAARLAEFEHRVLSAFGAIEFARASGQTDFDPVTEHRRAEFQNGSRGAHGTVGAVACDHDGRIAAATSTGGIGHEQPGRVSDSATVAGTFASASAAVSCTGRGEQIVDHAVAARVVTRVDDGADLQQAVQQTLREAAALSHQYGLIAVDRRGRWQSAQTGDVTTLYAVRCAQTRENFLR